ncbi:hypothetical protein SLEP1_g34505 [Rubroshorea leprosula]|uniref:Uncharacterized protein n=1 Tax=Rubroshorea leprosula TaxID=152421 RepID=A0AAV5KK59_9ROSI|nr:hypothetical protein SLEP1_g34505 [Rubroshorea leprosula]
MDKFGDWRGCQHTRIFQQNRSCSLWKSRREVQGEFREIYPKIGETKRNQILEQEKKGEISSLLLIFLKGRGVGGWGALAGCRGVGKSRNAKMAGEERRKKIADPYPNPFLF